MQSIRPLAVYLPQFHPIPENDQWWGKGFTEWTNVTKAKPLFKKHWQPRLPADLGFYDLRVAEVREAQAMLAKEYGIYGFCYWHYWFAGKRIIERPFTEVVKSGKPDFPFCVAWANQTWAGTWHGLSNNQTLIEQTYPGVEDYTAHFYSLLEAFADKRYIEVNGKKLVFIFSPMEIPDSRKFIETWQELAIKENLGGIHFVGMHMGKEWVPELMGYDAMLHGFLEIMKYKNYTFKEKIQRYFHGTNTLKLIDKKRPDLISYPKYVERYPDHQLKANEYPWIYSDWDNTPRTGTNGWLFEGSTPELFGELCTKAFEATANKVKDEKIVILRSWNEWAEGNYLEPDHKFGTAYLEAFRTSLINYDNEVSII
ncbi:lipopolysaccharide biosynthesis protein [Ginsengibacter hankyongi]|uniref:Lipopolysaccharide biosynthesis protein n=1 Tax=Ginsengibacter hankyongi TaxID=2607284 RepID=A0A5J5IDM4_9BACT|nr:glycoside hydrolase family 99-like domain-containing protein [Ginsengibacter hankyongi]KAA9036390.1 lipopolysaccharide biosynthesis protein [Ginsengibacter hankyongi]